MIVTFTTKSYADITMFGEVAIKLLKLMGHSGTVPSAVLPEDIPLYLENLQKGLERTRNDADDTEDSDSDEPAIGLHKRALPLIELLQSAYQNDDSVIWK